MVAPELHYFSWAFYVMTFLEKDLEQIIYESGRDLLEEKGLSIEGKLYRQLRIGNYGIADLVSVIRPVYDWDINCKRTIFIPGEITIYELKKEKIGISAFLQSLSYMRGIESYLNKRCKKHLFNISICLIGKEIDESGSFCYLSGLEEFPINFMTYSYNINGIIFKRVDNFCLMNEGF
jgi:hypothetical protein